MASFGEIHKQWQNIKDFETDTHRRTMEQTNIRLSLILSTTIGAFTGVVILWYVWNLDVVLQQGTIIGGALVGALCNYLWNHVIAASGTFERLTSENASLREILATKEKRTKKKKL